MLQFISPSVLNAFLEDTCVVFTCAFFLSRLRGLSELIAGAGHHGAFVGRRRQLALGFIFGLLATSEVVFPGMRSPYVFHTLVICLAVFFSGATGTVVAILILGLCSTLSTTIPTTEFTLVAVSTVAAVCLVARLFGLPSTALVVAGSGALGQALVVATSRLFLHNIGLTPATDLHAASIPANCLGLLMVMFVMQDAEARSRSESQRLEAEHYRTLALSAEFNALRAQIKPHFLFNVLAAIAALCRIDAAKAESMVLKLGQLLRRSLEDSPSTLTTVDRELDFVRTYLDIQKARHEKVVAEIKCSKDVAKAEIPAFSIQTLVENAYNHGFVQGRAREKVMVGVSRSSRSVFVSVSDNGVGMSRDALASALKADEGNLHGLYLVDRQLRIQFGNRARLRVFSAENRGTIAAFKIPRSGSNGWGS